MKTDTSAREPQKALFDNAKMRKFDILLAVGLTLFASFQAFAGVIAAAVAPKVLALAFGGATGFYEGSSYFTFFLILACFIPLIWRRNRPLLVLLVSTLAHIAFFIWTHDPLVTIIGPLVALYTVGTRVSTKQLIAFTIVVAFAVSAASFVPSLQPEKGYVVTSATMESPVGSVDAVPGQRVQIKVPDSSESIATSQSPEEPPAVTFSTDTPPFSKAMSLAFVDFISLSRGSLFTRLLQIIALIIVAAVMGRSTRLRHEYIAAVEERAAEAERTREETSRRRAEEERLRIARELHDITAHSLSAVTVQAGAAKRLTVSNPELAQQAIENIRETSKAALDELRLLVGVLRNGEENEVPLVPEASLSRIWELGKYAEDAGFSVKMDVAEIEDVPVYVGLAAYRIVQEAFTNTIRHAKGAKTLTVTIENRDDKLLVTIIDDGKEAAGSGVAVDGKEAVCTPQNDGGHGITGMCERAVALGGSLQAHRRTQDEGGGFIVCAELPWRKP